MYLEAGQPEDPESILQEFQSYSYVIHLYRNQITEDNPFILNYTFKNEAAKFFFHSGYLSW